MRIDVEQNSWLDNLSSYSSDMTVSSVRVMKQALRGQQFYEDNELKFIHRPENIEEAPTRSHTYSHSKVQYYH